MGRAQDLQLENLFDSSVVMSKLSETFFPHSQAWETGTSLGCYEDEMR